MDEKIKSPVDIITAALANMAEWAIEIEQKYIKATKDAEDWYKLFLNKDAKCAELEEKLAAEIAAHRETQRAFRSALSTAAKKGKSDNEKLQKDRATDQAAGSVPAAGAVAEEMPAPAAGDASNAIAETVPSSSGVCVTTDPDIEKCARDALRTALRSRSTRNK